MIDVLNKLMQNRILCEIYSNTENTDKFNVGYISALDKNFCRVNSFDFYGNYDGSFCILTSDIFSVQTNTKYLNCIDRLIKKTDVDYTKDYSSNDILNDIILEIKNGNRICQIELCDSNLVDISGIIKNYNRQTGTLELQIFDQYGDNDGKSFVDIQTISRIEYDTCDTRRLESLTSKLF